VAPGFALCIVRLVVVPLHTFGRGTYLHFLWGRMRGCWSEGREFGQKGRLDVKSWGEWRRGATKRAEWLACNKLAYKKRVYRATIVISLVRVKMSI